MSAAQQSTPVGRRGPRPRWDSPKLSCGDFVTTLPNSEHKVWLPIGPAAEIWESLNPKIRALARDREFRNIGVSFFIYMIGRTESTASPKIIFCSSDITARKNLRNAVRQSDILNDYPSIGLGDTSSPLARSDNGLNGLLHPSRPRLARVPPAQEGTRTRSVYKPISQSPRSAQALGPPNADKSQTHGNMGSWAAARHNELNRNFQSLSLDERRSSHSSASFSGTGSDSLTPRSSRRFSIAESTTRSSVDLDSASQVSATGATNAKHEVENIPDDQDVDSRDDGSELESFSDTDSANEPTPPEDNPTLPGGIAVKLFTQRLLEAYESHRQLTFAKQQGGSRSSEHVTQKSSERSTSSTLPSGKRPFQHANEAFAEGASNEPIPTVKKRKTEGQTEKTFACPFWKKDPRRNPGCFRHELKRVNRVKQHLKSKHKIPIRCPICQRPFENRNECDEHVRQTTCQTLPRIMDEGISEEQAQALAAKGRADLTQEQRWYRIWDIIFPGVPHPSSPYRDEGISEDARDALRFYNEEGRTILLDHMREADDWSPDADEARFNSPFWRQVWEGFFQDMGRRFMMRLSENEARQPDPPALNSAPLDMSPISAQCDVGEEEEDEDDARENEPTQSHEETPVVVGQEDASGPSEPPDMDHLEDTMWEPFNPYGLFPSDDTDAAACEELDAQDDMTGSGYVPFPSNIGGE